MDRDGAAAAVVAVAVAAPAPAPARVTTSREVGDASPSPTVASDTAFFIAYSMPWPLVILRDTTPRQVVMNAWAGCPYT